MKEPSDQGPEKEEQSDQGPEEQPSSDRKPDLKASPSRNRVRRAFGFLRAPSFWGGLVVGLVALGVGVVIGLGVDRWMDDDRGRHSDERGQLKVHTFRIEPGGDWDGEGPQWPGSKRFRFRLPAEKFGEWQGFGEGKEWEGKRSGKEGYEGRGFSPKDDPRRRSSYLSDEELALVERFIDVIEELIDEVGDHLERGGFDRPGGGSFGPGGFFEGDFWKEFEGRFFGDRNRSGDGWFEGYPDSSRNDHDGFPDEGLEDEGLWNEEEGFLDGFRLPFGEFLPGFTFLEDCELDPLKLPDIFESLPNEEEGLEDSESLEEFFGQIEELIREACEQPAGG